MDSFQNSNNLMYVLAGLGVLTLFTICLFGQYTTEENVSEVTRYTTQTENTNGMELGDSKVSTAGVDGEDVVTYRTHGSLAERIFKNHELDKVEISRSVNTAPVEEVTLVGTMKYQYMHCTDGSSRMYSDEQFADPNTGFTSKSPDYCAQNNQGVKTRLSHLPPEARQTTCVDVTSYDWNWSNDVFCTNPDGSTYYTSYEDAGW